MENIDRLLDIGEAAQILKISKDWLYRDKKYKTLPFTIVLSARKIRFSLTGMLKWLEEQQNGRKDVQEGRDVAHSL